MELTCCKKPVCIITANCINNMMAIITLLTVFIHLEQKKFSKSMKMSVKVMTVVTKKYLNKVKMY